MLVIASANAVDMYSDIAITIVPAKTEWTILPRAAATIIATINGIVAKSPKGRTLLPGNMTASTKVIGTSINAVAITAG